MSAEIVYLKTAIHKPASKTCWSCVAVWCGPPALVVTLFAWWVL